MKVERTHFAGWDYEYPVYRVRSYDDYRSVCEWMIQNECDEFLVGSGSNGYFFQVRLNHEWFALRWA